MLWLKAQSVESTKPCAMPDQLKEIMTKGLKLDVGMNRTSPMWPALLIDKAQRYALPRTAPSRSFPGAAAAMQHTAGSSSSSQHTSTSIPANMVVPQMLPVHVSTPSLNSVRNVSPEDKAYANARSFGLALQQRPKSSHQSKFFSVTIKVTPNESCDGDSCCQMERETVVSVLGSYIRKNTIEGVLIQSVEGDCLTLSGAIRFDAPHDQNRLQQNLRERHVLNCFKDKASAVQVMCTVTTPCEEERHAIYETLRQMVRRLPSAPAAAAALVLDTVPAAADPPAPMPAGGVRHGAAAAPGGGAPAAAVQILGRAPPPASPATPRATGCVAAVGASRTDPGLRAGSAGPPAAAASCDSEVGPLCGRNRSTCIRVVVKVVGGFFGGHLASRVVDVTSRFFEGRQMDHIVSTAATDPQLGLVDLVCVAAGPGQVDAPRTATSLRRAIAEAFHGGAWQQGAVADGSGWLRQVEVVPSTEAEFQAAKAALVDKVRDDDTAFHLIVEGGPGVAATRAVLNSRASARSRREERPLARKRRRSSESESRGGLVHSESPPGGGAEEAEMRDSEGIGATPSSPPGAGEAEMRDSEGIGETPSSLPPTAASFAAVAAAGRGPGGSAAV